MGTGAVSRYRLSRSQKIVMVQDLNCVQMRVSGYNCHYGFVLGAGAKAKTVTSLLPQPTVLVCVWQLPTCHVIEKLSPKDSLCKWFEKLIVARKFLPFASQMQVAREFCYQDKNIFPFAFVWLEEQTVSALRWLQRVSSQGIL